MAILLPVIANMYEPTLEPTAFSGNFHKIYLKDNGVPPLTTIKFGALYNWYAATDARNICAEGWDIPTKDQITELYDYAGGFGAAGYALSKVDDLFWYIPNFGTDIYGFGVKGGGVRYGNNGTFGAFKIYSYIWAKDDFIWDVSMAYDLGPFACNYDLCEVSADDKNSGHALRPIKSVTTLSHGETGTYVGNDGKTYPTICIGTQEWVADNLAETKFRTGEDIPILTNNTAWSNCGGILTMATIETGNIVTYGGSPSAPIILSQSVNLTDCYINNVNLSGDGMNPGTDYKIRLSIYTSVGDLPVTKLFESSNVINANAGISNIFTFDDVFLTAGNYCLVTSYEDIVVFDDVHNMNFSTNSTNQYTNGKLAYFANGGWIISSVLDLLGTINFTSGGMCYYNNDPLNA